jgi:hypothetical protein
MAGLGNVCPGKRGCHAKVTPVRVSCWAPLRPAGPASRESGTKQECDSATTTTTARNGRPKRLAPSPFRAGRSQMSGQPQTTGRPRRAGLSQTSTSLSPQPTGSLPVRGSWSGPGLLSSRHRPVRPRRKQAIRGREAGRHSGPRRRGRLSRNGKTGSPRPRRAQNWTRYRLSRLRPAVRAARPRRRGRHGRPIPSRRPVRGHHTRSRVQGHVRRSAAARGR